MASYLLRRKQGGCRFAPQSGATTGRPHFSACSGLDVRLDAGSFDDVGVLGLDPPRVVAARQPTMLSRSQTLGFEPWIETKGLNQGQRYSFAKTAAANKIMFTKAMNATVT
jgi:hypothetical protein